MCFTRHAKVLLIAVWNLILLQGWKPPFAADMDKFVFTPRIQPLNELEVRFSSLEVISK